MCHCNRCLYNRWSLYLDKDAIKLADMYQYKTLMRAESLDTVPKILPNPLRLLCRRSQRPNLVRTPLDPILLHISVLALDMRVMVLIMMVVVVVVISCWHQGYLLPRRDQSE